ncbi:hypothetical protein HU200_060445 [Digitaria exilis]|uniref:Uncharacterized protein n=1 Tax=Digitaria exilis TaxID=1010633 RepID=A0A835A991_9POAL|nr:hypothetical protein HU200_060445 [Digitaria exilis]
MELSAAHLRLLQEARERVNAKENPSGPSSNTSCNKLSFADCWRKATGKVDKTQNLQEGKRESIWTSSNTRSVIVCADDIDAALVGSESLFHSFVLFGLD